MSDNEFKRLAKKMPKQATWLMPGLSVKRWLGAIMVGITLLGFGVALSLNLQPVTFTINVLRELALMFPSPISGPIFTVMGMFLLYYGFKRTYNTVYSAMAPDGAYGDLLETLYRRNKLAHGPKIAAIGGGTGLSTLLRGIKHYTSNITAVVTVGDDGGSSGRLRKEQGVIPPGDIRNCIAALADEEQLITELFQYRFSTGSGLEGHSFGNLFLTAMCRVSGDMVSAIKESSKVLNIRGRVLPSTLDNVNLLAEMEDGRLVYGESDIPKAGGKIKQVRCEPASPQPLPDVIRAIEDSELIILGPGSLFTSVVPNLLIDEIAKAVSRSKAPKVYVVNIMTQPGETDSFSVADHVEAIMRHARYPNMINCVLVNDWLPDGLAEKYEAANCFPVKLDESRCNDLGVSVLRRRLVDEDELKVIRHNPKKLARAIIRWFKKEYDQGKLLKAPDSLTWEVLQESDADLSASSMNLQAEPELTDNPATIRQEITATLHQPISAPIPKTSTGH